MNNEDQNQPTPPTEPVAAPAPQPTPPENPIESPVENAPTEAAMNPADSPVPPTSSMEMSPPPTQDVPVAPAMDAPQPPMQNEMQGGQTTPVQQHHTDVLGIVSIIMAFLGLQLVGFILGLVGVSKAKKNGQSTTLSRVGWILNLVLGIIATLVIVGLVLAGFQGTQTQARDTERQTDINAIYAKLEESYYTNGYYPAEISTNTLTGIDPEALKDPKGAGYSYVVTPSGCTKCASYTLSASLESTTSKSLYGDTYKKQSLYDVVDPSYNSAVPSSNL